MLGIVLGHRGNLLGPRNEFETAVKLTPDSVTAPLHLGATYCFLGDLRSAVSQLRTALDLNPNYGEAHYYLGLAYQEQGKSDLALEELQSAAKLNPHSAEAHNSLGMALQRDGYVADAARNQAFDGVMTFGIELQTIGFAEFREKEQRRQRVIMVVQGHLPALHFPRQLIALDVLPFLGGRFTMI